MATPTIKSVEARLTYDSRGNPIDEVTLTLSDGSSTRAAAKASIGTYEDGEMIIVSQGTPFVNKVIAPALVGKDPTDQASLDNLMLQKLDGIKNELGGCEKMLFAVSCALCKAGAIVLKIPLYKHIANLASNRNQLVLPVPAFNVINGGSLAGNKFPIQEVTILPVGASSYKEGMMIGYEVYHSLMSEIKEKYGKDAIIVGDEGGFAPDIQGYKEGFKLVIAAIARAGYTGKVSIGMNVAASEFYGDDKTYNLNYMEEIVGVSLKERAFGFFNDLFGRYTECNEKISGEQLKELYKPFVNKNPIVSIEGPFHHLDKENYANMTAECGEQLQIVGDDLLIYDSVSLEKAIDEKTCNALLLKVNEFGSVTEIIESVKMSMHAGWGVTASHHSGDCEIEDTFIADLSVGLGMGLIKSGAPGRSANYSQLLQIEEELGSEIVYAGANFRKPVEPY